MITRARSLLLCALLAIGTAQSAVVFSNPPDHSGGSDLNGFLEADDFTLAASWTINQLKFWSLQSAPSDYTGSIDWAIRANAAGVPGANIASGTATPAAVAGLVGAAFGLDEYSYTFPVNVVLGPGTYWVILHNGPSASIPTTTFYWEWANGNAGNSQSSDIAVGGPWVGNSAELALEVSGDLVPTPEPGSLLLIGLGLVGGAVMRWKAVKSS